MLRVTLYVQNAFDKLNCVEKSQVPFALSLAINETVAEAVSKDIPQEIERTFDRPTRWTKRAFRFERASKRRPYAVVKRKTAQGRRHYLDVQNKGGVRPQSGLEKLLVSRLKYAGIVQTVVPAQGARLTSAGNWSPGQRNQALSAIKAQRDRYSNTTSSSRTRNRKRSDFFVPRLDNKLSPGIYERKRRGRQIKKIAHFSSSVANYRKRLDIKKPVKLRMALSFNGNFRSALRRAIVSAK